VDTYLDGTRDEFAMNFYGEDDGGWKAADSTFSASATAKKTTSSDGAKTNEDLYVESNATDKMKLYANRAEIASEAASNAYLNTVYNHFLKDTDDDNDFLTDTQAILMMLSSRGTAYTWEDAYKFTMPADVDHMAVSFFVKSLPSLIFSLLDFSLISFPVFRTAKLSIITSLGNFCRELSTIILT
jgi:hypothetical protein